MVFGEIQPEPELSSIGFEDVRLRRVRRLREANTSHSLSLSLMGSVNKTIHLHVCRGAYSLTYLFPSALAQTQTQT